MAQNTCRRKTIYMISLKRVEECKWEWQETVLIFDVVNHLNNVLQALLAFYLIDDLNMRDSAKAVVCAVS